MPSHRSWWVGLTAVCIVAVCVGCPKGGPEPGLEPTGPAAPEKEEPGEPRPTDQTTAEKPEPPPPLEVPEVHLTEALRKTCFVVVGDPLPEGELPDMEGNPRSLARLYGEKFTVVLFWTGGQSMLSHMAATAALEDLQKDIAEPYAEKGIKVVAINVNNPPDEAGKQIGEAKTTFPNLSDPQGDFFSRVASEGLPRIYLLDAEGRIIWFDLEYSRATRRNLLQAIQVKLGETGAAAEG